MIKEGDIATLNQLLKTLEETYPRFEKAYNKRDSESFNKYKKIMLDTQRKISDMIK